MVFALLTVLLLFNIGFVLGDLLNLQRNEAKETRKMAGAANPTRGRPGANAGSGAPQVVERSAARPAAGTQADATAGRLDDAGFDAIVNEAIAAPAHAQPATPSAPPHRLENRPAANDAAPTRKPPAASATVPGSTAAATVDALLPTSIDTALIPAMRRKRQGAALLPAVGADRPGRGTVGCRPRLPRSPGHGRGDHSTPDCPRRSAGPRFSPCARRIGAALLSAAGADRPGCRSVGCRPRLPRSPKHGRGDHRGPGCPRRSASRRSESSTSFRWIRRLIVRFFVFFGQHTVCAQPLKYGVFPQKSRFLRNPLQN